MASKKLVPSMIMKFDYKDGSRKIGKADKPYRGKIMFSFPELLQSEFVGYVEYNNKKLVVVVDKFKPAEIIQATLNGAVQKHFDNKNVDYITVPDICGSTPLVNELENQIGDDGEIVSHIEF